MGIPFAAEAAHKSDSLLLHFIFRFSLWKMLEISYSKASRTSVEILFLTFFSYQKFQIFFFFHIIFRSLQFDYANEPMNMQMAGWQPLIARNGESVSKIGIRCSTIPPFFIVVVAI